jgi:predicted acyltransferase
MGESPPQQTSGQAPPAVTDRVYSLDAYRGFVMLLMIAAGFGTKGLMKDPTWGWLADQCEHRTWVGCTLWDLIQPSFMFLVGASMPFAFAKRRERGQSWGRQFVHVLKRALLLILIGVFLDSFGQPVVTVQFIRVLQQIAIGYVLAFFLLPLRPTWQAVAAVLFLAAHTGAHIAFGRMHGINPWDVHQNFGVWLDHQMHAPFDRWVNPSILPPPKGDYAQFNAISSTATILFGVMAGGLLRSGLSVRRQVLILLVAGVGGLLVGLALSGGPGMDGGIPAIKRIWTASFGVFAAGWTCLMLAVFHGITDGLRWRGWAFPFAVAGMNSIALYVMAGTLRRPVESALLPFTAWPLSWLNKSGPEVLDRWVPSGGSLRPAADALVPLLHNAPPIGTACLVVVAMWAMCYWLYRHRIFFKV